MNARRPTRYPALSVLTSTLFLLAASPWLAAGEAEEPPKDPLAALVDSLPDVDRSGKYTGPPPDEAEKKIRQVLKGGKDRLLALLAMLKEPEKGEDYKADYLLHAIATRAKRPGAEDERTLVCDAIATALAKRKSPYVRWHLLEELKWIGGKESADAASRFLLDEELSDYAAEVLVLAQAPEPLRAAAARAKGKPLCHVIAGLGALRAAQGLPPVLQALKAQDADLRRVAAHALANSGEPAAVEPMLALLRTDSPYEKSQAIDSLLLLARRLGAAGHTEPAERICRHILQTEKDAVHVQCAALLALAEAVGEKAMDDVLAAMGSENPTIRNTAIEAAIAMPGAEATAHWVERLEAAPPASKVGLLDLLARRGDPAALPAVLEATKHRDPQVRLAAIRTVGHIGDRRAVAPLATLLAAEDSAERSAARNALLRLRDPEATAAMADLLPRLAPDVRATLLGILAARDARQHLDAILPHTRDQHTGVASAAAAAVGQLADYPHLAPLTRVVVETEQGAVRGAAEKALNTACQRLRDKNRCVAAVAAALEGAQGPARAALLRVLGEIGNRTALNVVRQGLQDPDAEVQDAAIRALAEWPTPEPTEQLLAIAQKTEKLTHHVLALRGVVHMIRLQRDRPADQRLALCRQAMGAARRPEEKREVLGAIAEVADPQAVAMAEACLQDPALKDEAAMALLRIAKAIAPTHRQEAKEAVQKAMAATDSKQVQKEGESVLYEIERTEDFITAWLVAGPYPGGVGNKKHFPPEKPDAKDVEWKLVAATDGRQPGVVDLHREVTRGGSVTAYLKCQIHSPKAQDARLEIGTDDGVKVWLNGELVHDKDVPRSLTINEDKVPVKLKEGWNELLLRVTEGGGDWAACCRVRGPDGGKLRDIQFRAE